MKIKNAGPINLEIIFPKASPARDFHGITTGMTVVALGSIILRDVTLGAAPLIASTFPPSSVSLESPQSLRPSTAGEDIPSN